jgi:hypothetical protein
VPAIVGVSRRRSIDDNDALRALSGTLPFVWHITVSYSFDADGGLVQSNVRMSEKLFSPATSASSFHTMDPFLVFHSILAVLSFWMLLLSFKELHRGWRLYKV